MTRGRIVSNFNHQGAPEAFLSHLRPSGRRMLSSWLSCRWEGLGGSRCWGLISHMTEQREVERSRTCRTGLRRSGSRCRCPWRAWSAGICCPAGGWWCGPAEFKRNLDFNSIKITFVWRLANSITSVKTIQEGFFNCICRCVFCCVSECGTNDHCTLLFQGLKRLQVLAWKTCLFFFFISLCRLWLSFIQSFIWQLQIGLRRRSLAAASQPCSRLPATVKSFQRQRCIKFLY